MTDLRIKNKLRLLTYFFCTYLLSVSIGINAVAIPNYIENNPNFGAFSSTIILSAESLIAIALCLVIQQIIRRMGLFRTLLIASLIRIVATLLLAYFESTFSWVILSVFVGAGSFLYLLLLQICIHNTDGIRYKGMIYAIFGTLISLGIATGPVVYSETDFLIVFFGLQEFVSYYLFHDMSLYFVAGALITLLSVLPFLWGKWLIPKISVSSPQNLFKIVKSNKGVLFAVALCGISFFGVSWYITIYGIRNQLSLFDASLLLSAFMMGSVSLDTLISFISEYMDRRFVLVYSALICTILAVFLPLAIYNKYHAFILLFLWGGLVSGMYSNSLYLLEKKYAQSDSTATNAAFSMMENFGATFGLLLIGAFINFIGTDAFSYIIIIANMMYFTFVLILYQSKHKD